MDFAQSGEPFTIVPSEEEVDGLVGVEPEELSYDLDGEDLGIGELGGWSAPSDAAFLESVVDEAEDADDEGAKIHRKRPPSLRLVWAPPSVGRSPMLFNRSEKLAHGVSYRSSPKASNNLLKSALDVSTNTPRLPPSPMHAVHSPPEYAQPC